MRIGAIVVLVLLAVLLAGCAAGANPLTGARGGETMAEEAPAGGPGAGDAEKPAGFLLGLWHGFIALFTFIISLFSDSVGVYEVYNSGGWYDFGFVLGAMMFFGGGGGGASRRGCRDR